MRKLLVLFVLLIVGCSMSTEELEQEVLISITEQLNENTMTEDAEVVGFHLVHKGGNEYKGVIELIMPNPVSDLFNSFAEMDILDDMIEVTYSVEVIYDGETYTWEIITD
tara:strand:+ start:194 stop:523 length:330 start_codon:yes stop_codon:yes gene_type:complete